MNKYKSSYIIVAALLLISALTHTSCNSAEPEKETGSKSDSSIKSPDSLLVQWKNEKLSLFVHFGAYSSLAGKWKDNTVDGPAEEIWANSNMFSDDYEKVARDFDPKDWEPKTLVDLSRDVGMKTIILSAKHMDGFCLFKTETTPFNTVDFTSFNTDIVGELANACKSVNMKFAISFSLTDWHLPSAHPMAGHHGNPVSEVHHKVNLEQIKELLTNYGPISQIYFHSGINTPKQSRELRELIKSLQPECLISNGIGNDLGDFIATDFNEQLPQLIHSPWIMTATLNKETRGYHEGLKNDSELEIARKKVREMVNILSNGGNYALNVGPTGDGSISEFEETTLNHIGRWIKVNRKAIFETQKAPFQTESQFWKVTQKDNRLYLFVDSVPASKKIKLTGFDNEITGARFLGSGIEPDFAQNGRINEITWTSPAMADPMQLPVIEVDFKDTLTTKPKKVININPKDTVTLDHQNAKTLRSISSGDKHNSIISTTGLIWHINAKHELKSEIKFTEEEQNRDIFLTTNSSENRIKLEGEQDRLIRTKSDTIETGKIYQSVPFYGSFDELHINPNGKNKIQVSRSSWIPVSNDSKKSIPPLPMTAHYYYVEIESENNQQYCYEVTGNDGLQIWLNKEELFVSRNPKANAPISRKLVFNLEKGKNILIIKNYNRLGTEDLFNLNPIPDAHWYIQTVPIPPNPGKIEILKEKPSNPHQDINLPNLSIILTSKN